MFAVEDGQARLLPVETGLETDGWTEVTGGEVKAGMSIVTMGQFLLDDGTAVTVVEGSD